MTNKRLIFALLHRFVGLPALRAAIKAFSDVDNVDVQEVIDFVKLRLSTKEIAKVQNAIAQPNAMEELRRELDEGGVTVIAMGDDLYPASLLNMKSPLPLLYAKGDIRSVNLPGIGICGSRSASQKGLDHAKSFGRITADENVTEISGYARGVDEEAHLGALKAGGKSIAVLAEGILRFRHKRAFREIPDLDSRMVVVSEFHPHRPWSVYNAMQRNNTILGLSEALVVVEASAKGGTLDAGLKCLKQKKPLFVLQYKDEHKTPSGNRTLIEMGGVPVRTNRQLSSLMRGAVRKSGRSISHRSRQASLTI